MLIPSALLGLCVFLSYAAVIGNVGGAFPVSTQGRDYFSSPWWVGMPRHNAIAFTVMQLLAGAGAIVWLAWLLHARVERGPLASPLARQVVVYAFLLASLAWPFMAYPAIARRPSLTSAVLACIPLWIAALSIIAALAFSFEARAPLLPMLGITLLSLVVVLVDGVGWSASCIFGAVHPD